MAEAELSVLSGQCLDRWIPDNPTLIEEINAWQQERNRNHTEADWQFTAADAASSSSGYIQHESRP